MSAAANILKDAEKLGTDFDALGESDRALVADTLSASDDASATLALHLLRGALSERSLVVLANLREVLRVLPGIPFFTLRPLSCLESLGYEATPRSYRQIFDTEASLFGIELVGQGQVVEALVIHTSDGRHTLGTPPDPIVDDEVARVMICDPGLALRLLEALEELGLGVEPHPYAQLDEYLSVHGAQAAGLAFGELF